MKGSWLAFPLAVALTLVAFAYQQPGEPDGAAFENIAARYQTLLLRQPRRGTAFDQLYRHYLDAGRLEELFQRYSDLSQAQPQNAAAQMLFGLVCQQRGKNEEALAACRRAAELKPDDYYPVYYQGLLLMSLHRDAEAARALEQALPLNPPAADLLDLLKRLGRLYARQGDLPQALRAWGQLAEKFPGDRFALEELAELLAEEEQFDEAIRRYEQLAALAKDDLYKKLMAQVEIGQLQVRQGKLKTAIATFEQCLGQVQPESWMAGDIRRRIEQIFIRQDDLAGLADYYAEQLKRRPEELNLMVRRAAITAKLGKREEALEQYRAAVKRAPTRRDLREALREELVRAERLDEAIAEAEQLVERLPGDVQSHQRLGELHLLRGKDTGKAAEAERNALAAWKRIAEIRPSDPALAVTAAELCRQGAGVKTRSSRAEAADPQAPAIESTLAKAALEYYREAIRRRPEPQYHEYCGDYLHAIGRTPEAIETWRQMAASPRDNADNLKRLAEVLASADETAAALEAMQAALTKAPDRTDLHLLAADLAARLKQYDAALEHVAALERLADSPAAEEQALLRRVEVYSSAGRLTAELEQLRARLEKEPGTLRETWLAATLAAADRRYEAALAYLERARKIAPADGRLLRLGARIHQQGGDLGGAVRDFRRLAELEPRSKTAHLREVVSLELELGRVEQAREAAEEVLRAAPSNLESIQLLADVQMRSGQMEKAVETLRRALRAQPRDLDLRLAFAQRMAQHQRLEEAIEHYWRAFELAEEANVRISVTAALAEQYLIAARFEELIERLQRMRRTQEDPLVITLCLVEAHLRGEDFVSARREVGGLLAQRPNDAQVLSQMVSLSEKLDDFEQAVQYQEQVVELKPERPNLERLASLYTRLGRKEDAEAAWARITRQAADAPTLLATLDRALAQQNHEQVIALAGPEWSRRPDDWRFGIRLALSLWYRDQQPRAAEICSAIQNLLPNPQYEKEALPPAKQPVNPYGNYPPLLMRTSLPMQMRQMLANSNQSYYGGFMPRTLTDAQLMAALVRYEVASRKGQAEAHLAELDARAKQENLAAVQQLAWIRLSLQQMSGLEPVLEQWVKLSPQDAEPRVLQFMAPMYVARSPQGIAANDPKLLAGMKSHYAWLAEHKPEISRYLAGTYVEILFSSGEEQEAGAELRRAIDQAATLDEMARLMSTLRRRRDGGLWEKVFARVQQLQQTPGSGSQFSSAYFLQQFLPLAIQEKNWPQVLTILQGYLGSSHPSVIRPNGLTSNVNAAASPFTAGMPPSRAPTDKIGRFPSPSAWLDQSRLASLEMVHRSLRAAGEEEKLRALVERQINESQGVPRQCWQMAAIHLKWWAGEEEQSLEMLDAFARQTPGNLELATLRARALAARQEYERAMAAIKDVYTPFGAGAKSLEELRLELATKVNDEDAAEQAALRLFGMRLSSSEQLELAGVMRRLGLSTRSEELLKRAERTAGSNAAQLYQLMQQTAQTDPERSVQVARRLLSQTRRSSQSNSPENNYRVEAYRILAKSGQLQAMIDEARKQLEAAPKSQMLLSDLSDYYTAAGNEEQALAMLQRIAEAHPTDSDTSFRVAQALFRRQKYAEGIERLAIVWEKNPTLILSQSYEVGGYYVRAKQTEKLAEHMRKLKDSPALQQNSHAVLNLVQNLSNNNFPLDDTVKLYQVAIDVSPPEMRGEAIRQYGELLIGKGRKPQAYELYKDLLLPKSEKTAVTSSAVMYVNESLVTPAIRLADLAVELKKTDELNNELTPSPATDAPPPLAQLLRAMLQRRAGDEQPLASLGQRYLKEQPFSLALGQHGETLREELFQCRTQPALEVAAEVWQPARRANSGVYYGSSAGREHLKLAEIQLKLNQRAKARQTLLEASQRSVPSGYSAGMAEQVLQQQAPVAAAMLKHEFLLDALNVYRRMLRTDLSSLSENSYARRSLLPQAANGVRNCTKLILQKQADETLASLLTELSKTEGAIDLGSFLAVGDPPQPDTRSYSPSQTTKPTEPLKAQEQLLPALLQRAHEAGQLDAIAEQTARQLAAAPQSSELAALDLLIAIVRGPAKEAAPRLASWQERVASKTSLAASDETWLVALAALDHAETRDVGRQLTVAVAKAAGARGDTSRQQAALATLTASAVDAAEGDALLEQLLADRKSDPNLLQQVAQRYLERKQYDKGIPLLAAVWQRAPELLLPRIDQLVAQYGEAERLDELARGLRLVTDRNLQSRYGSSLGNALRRLPTKQSQVQPSIDVYRAMMQITTSNQAYLSSQFSSYLRRLPENRQTLAAYRRAAFPDEHYAGEVRYLAERLVDLAKSQNALDELAADCRKAVQEHPAWAPQSELLLAMIEVRRGKEQPLIELAQRPAATPDIEGLLREELAKCLSKPALEAALQLWQKQAATETGTNTTSSSRVAALLVKLNDRQKARQALLETLKRPLSAEGYSNPEEHLAQQEIERRISVASQLEQNGFRLDALSVYAAATNVDTSQVPTGSYANSRLNEGHNQGRQLLSTTVATQLDEMLKQLRSGLVSETAPDLTGFFVVFDQPAAGRPSAPPNQPAVPDSLLPALLSHAKKQNQLAPLTQELAAAGQRFPEEIALVELAALISLESGDPQAAVAHLDKILQQLEQSPVMAEQSAIWLSARSALAQEATRSQGQRLAEAVALAAGKKGFRTRQEAAVTLIVESLAAAGQQEQAALALKRLFSDDGESGSSKLLLARILARQKKYSEAVETLAPAWQSDANLLLANLGELAVFYVHAGQAESLAAQLKEIKDPQLREQHAYAIVNATDSMGAAAQQEQVNAAVLLLRVALDFHPTTRQYAADRLTALLISKQRQAEAYDVFRQTVLPPGGPDDRLAPSAAAMLDLGKQMNKLDEIEAAAQEAAKVHPKWRYSGELFVAISQQKRGKEQALDALVQDYRKNSACRTALASSSVLMRTELAKCQARPSLELAAELWEAELQRQRSQNSSSGSNYRSGDSLAQIYLKLGKPEKAREVWLAALEEPMANYAPNYLPYAELQRREFLAQKLAAAALHFDSARLVAANLAIDPKLVQPYNIATRQTAARLSFKKSVHVLLCKQLDPTHAALIEALSSRRGPPDLELFFTLVPSAWTLAEQHALPEHIRQKTPARVELLPALLRHATFTQSLDKLAGPAEAAAKRHPNHRQLGALVTLIHLAGDDAEKALPELKALADRLKQDLELAAASDTLLVMTAALEAPPTREAGREILSHVFQAASAKKDAPLKTSLLERISSEDRSWLESKLPDLVKPKSAGGRSGEPSRTGAARLAAPTHSRTCCTSLWTLAEMRSSISPDQRKAGRPYS